MNNILLKRIAPTLLALFIAACGGGEDTQQLPVAPTVPTGVQPYAGPDPRSDDIQAWRINVWENLRIDDRCSRCHVPGIQAPFFMRDDDINDAFAAFFPYVDTEVTSQSEIVAKVAAGHNCWETEALVCGDNMLRWIDAWLLVGGITGSREIEIQPIAVDDLKERTKSKQFPLDPGLFAGSQLYTDLKTWCSACHTSAAEDPRKPFFADADSAIAYTEVISKINLQDPAGSRIVERPRDESHGCPQQECQNYANQLEQDIIDFAAQIPEPDPVDNLVASKAIVIADDGIVAAGGNRHETNLVALYEFKVGRGFTAFDTSGESPAMNLTITSEDMWMSNWGLEFDGGDQKAQASVEDSTKLYERIGLTGEYTIEAWVVPGNVSQEEAHILGYSGGADRRNFTLGQTLYNYDFFNRNTETDVNGEEALSTADADEDLQASLQYVVLTYDPVEGRRIYVNGEFTGDDDPVASGSIGNWSESFAFVLGNEVSGNRPWQGQIRMVAVHDRAFDQAQIDQNYAVEPGQKYFLIFNVDEWTGLTDSYVMFQASQYDQYSYLFTEPRFILLGDSQDPGTVEIQGMRIGINGEVGRSGQVFGNMDEVVTAGNYQDGGYPLSRLGTILPLRYGIELDEFFLSFEKLGNGTNVFTDIGSVTPSDPVNNDPVPEVGIRLFDEIYTTMAEVTGVYSTGTEAGDDFPEVTKTYLAVRQQLPPTTSIDGFSGAHQAGIAQIAIEYCNALVDDTTLRSAFWPDFSFPAGTPDVVLFSNDGGAARSNIIDPLIDKMMGINLNSQPLIGTINDTAPIDLPDNDNDPETIKVGMTIKGELNALITDLSACGNSCPPERVETIVKATCSAVLGNAAIAMQ